MTTYEAFFIFLPLLAILVWVIVYELRTGVIPDIATFASSVYFLVMGPYFGSKAWWNYPLGLIAIFGIGFSLSSLYTHKFKKEGIGGGALKMIGAVGAALGIIEALQFLAFFAVTLLIGGTILFIKWNKKAVPSSPFILLAVFCTLIWSNWKYVILSFFL